MRKPLTIDFVKKKTQEFAYNYTGCRYVDLKISNLCKGI